MQRRSESNSRRSLQPASGKRVLRLAAAPWSGGKSGFRMGIKAHPQKVKLLSIEGAFDLRPVVADGTGAVSVQSGRLLMDW